MGQTAGNWITTVNGRPNSDDISENTFDKYYRRTFGTTRVKFESTPIDRIIAEQCLTSNVQQRKFLVLYCHNEGDQFGRNVCEDWFKYSEIANKLSNAKCIVAGYNITSKIDRGILISLMRKVMDNEELDNQVYASIGNGNSQIYVFVPFLNTMTTQSHIVESMTQEDAIKMLDYVTVSFSQIQTQHRDDMRSAEETLTCFTFQQLMMTQLGNRDFDLFVKDEHVHFKNKIAFAHFGPPQNETGSYSSKQNRIIENTYKAIMRQSDKHASDNGTVIISFIYACCVEFTVSDTTGRADIKLAKFYPVPIFVLRKCFHNNENTKAPADADYCRVIIDNTLRVYTSWGKFLEENKYGKCVLCVPTNGQYDCDDNGNVLVDYRYTPECNMAQTALRALDTTASVAGLGSTALLVVAAIPAITMAPVLVAGAVTTGIGVGIYSMGRSVCNLVDRSEHEEELSITEGETRAAYINIVAGGLGFVGAGATAVVSALARNGAQIGRGTVFTINALSKATIAAGGLALGNSTCDVIYNYAVHNEKPSTLMLVQLGASALFFGNSVYNYKHGSLIVQDAQTNSIREIQDSLRSNRHRKTFTKLHKETIRMNHGDGNVGRAKVISTIRNANNVDETLAILTRNNKRFHKMGIKFSADKGTVSMNGKPMNIAMFSKATHTAHIVEVMALPVDKIPADTHKFSISFTKNELATAFNKVIKFASIENDVVTTLQMFAPYAQRKIIQLIEKVCNFKNNSTNDTTLQKSLQEMGIDVNIVNYVIHFLFDMSVDSLKLEKTVEKGFRTTQLLVNHYLCSRPITEKLVLQLINYLTSVMAGFVMEGYRAVNDRTRIVGVRIRAKCNLCPGHHHINYNNKL